ncbi:unnamed protein product [Darwinula stevensoni]|uniref:Sodium-coupled monocarboxylate transporter 1 n=1 Tax=Darwinula stevensoni TaxID=69355 RepID=A0A7R8XF21_9CRUS|nr:unnamed protein product [Darwinula stevensoni]CAG0888410.1 unnamed protein product [Darwinula stevensoni]
MGNPAEVYAYGSQWFATTFGVALGIFSAMLIFVPFFHKLQLSSIFEYFEMRYRSKSVRILGSVSFILQQVLYMTVALYAPVIAVSSVTPFHEWTAILVAGSICTVYTAIGALKGVIWTDVLQVFIMFAGLLLINIYGTVVVGGASKVWDIASQYQRDQIFNFSSDVYERHTFWKLVVHFWISWMVAHGCNPPAAQRYCSLKKVSTAFKAYLWNAILTIILWVLATFSGLVVFANYADCDPLKAGIITKQDQIIPYYVLDELGHVHGFPGIFLACLFSGALSTLSSGLNSLAAVTYVDGVMLTSWKGRITEFQAIVLTKFFALGYGIIVIALSFVLSKMELGVTTIATIFASMTQSPLAAVFIASMYLPFVNKYGAFMGLLVGMGMTGWLGIGARVHGVPPEPPLPSSVGGCFHNATLVPSAAFYSNLTSFTLSDPTPTQSPYPHVYDMSYLMLTPIGFSSALVTCIVVSLVTGGYSLAHLDDTLIAPTALRWYKKLRGVALSTRKPSLKDIPNPLTDSFDDREKKS